MGEGIDLQGREDVPEVDSVSVLNLSMTYAWFWQLTRP